MDVILQDPECPQLSLMTEGGEGALHLLEQK